MPQLPPFLPVMAWQVPVSDRPSALTEGGVLDDYIEGTLPLQHQFEVWQWLHDIDTWPLVGERIATEAEQFLA